jgi:hypothetical protein
MSPSFDRYNYHHHTSPPPPSYHRDLTIDTTTHAITPPSPPRVTYPTIPISPQKAFYNSEDISAPPISLSQPSRIDRQIKTVPYYTPPPPVVAPPPAPPKARTQPVQSVVIPTRGSSRDQGRMSSDRDRDRERPSRVSSERQPRGSSERQPRVSSERQPRVSSERQPRVSSERQPRVSSERQPRDSSERLPRKQWQYQQEQVPMDIDISVASAMGSLSPPPPHLPRKSMRRRAASNPQQE